jgi:predicted RNA-binding Zn ribbon-like protein
LIARLVNLATPGWRGGARHDPPVGDELVAAFAAEFGERFGEALLTAPDAGEGLRKLAVELREAILADTAEGKAARINELIGKYGARPYLIKDVDQPFHLHFHGTGGVLAALGGEFAAALALVMDGYGADRFGLCEARRCDAVYVDLTRNGSRRFCSAACTARAKTAAYRSRRRS